MSDPRPIGVFDSGVGGLTVLREIVRRTPHESTIYLGDNARAPYGPRSDEEVLAFSTQALDALVERDVKALVVACNTSTAVGIGAFRRRYDLPVLGVIRPGASAAALSTRNKRVGVIATPATIRSHAYYEAIKEEDPFVEVYELATPELVPLVEAGILDGPVVDATVRRSLAPLARRRRSSDGGARSGSARAPGGSRRRRLTPASGGGSAFASGGAGRERRTGVVEGLRGAFTAPRGSPLRGLAGASAQLDFFRKRSKSSSQMAPISRPIFVARFLK